MEECTFAGSKIIDEILDTAHPPVARFRLMSTGLAQNHMLPVSEELGGLSACLSCGNCVDACPVIAGGQPEELVARTSMALEHVVGEQCRRCYKCVALCPQIDRPVKDYVRSFRRVERITHYLLMFAVVFLALSGITIFHIRETLPSPYYFSLGVVHRVLAVVLLAAAVLYLVGDRRHFRRAFRKAFHWGREDWDWLANVARWVFSFGQQGRLMRGDFNMGQKLWYNFIMVAIPLFATSGIIRWIGPDVLPKDFVESATAFHSNLALVNDVLVTVHVCVKIVYPYVRDSWRGISASLALSRARRASQRHPANGW